MKNSLKKISAVVILTAMLVSMAACSSKPAASSSDAASVAPSSAAVSSEVASSEAASSEADSSAASAAATDVTEESYKAEILRIYTAVTEKSAAMAGVDPSDAAAAAEAIKAVIADVSPLYEEMAALEAPESLKEKQAIISEGATASVELLGLSLQMLEVSAGTASGDVAALQTELQGKMQELTVKATAFGTALEEVLA